MVLGQVISCGLCIVVQPKGPTHRAVAVDCLVKVSEDAYNFFQTKNALNRRFLLTYSITENLTTPAFEIQATLLKRLHRQKVWSVEIIEGEAKLKFTAYSENDFRRPVVTVLSDLYVLVCDSLENLDIKLNYLAKAESFNSEAFFIVYYSKTVYTQNEEIVKKAFKVIFGYSIRYVVVVIPKTLTSFEHYIFKMEAKEGVPCFAFSSYTLTMLPNKSNNLQNIFGEIVIKDYNKCYAPVQALPYPPFVMKSHMGVEIDILKLVGLMLNLTFIIELYPNYTMHLGEQTPNGTWTGFLEPIFSDWQLGIGSIPPDSELTEDFTFSVPYIWNQNVYVVPIAALVPSWRILMAIFTVPMWGICLASLVGFAGSCYLVKNQNEMRVFQTFGGCVVVAFQLVLAHPVHTHPRGDLVRVLFEGFAILCIILNCVYTCSLIYFLQNPVRERQISTQEEIISSGTASETLTKICLVSWFAGLTLGGSPVYKEMFNTSTDPSVRALSESYVTVDEPLNSESYWLNMVVQQGNISTIGVKANLIFLMQTHSGLVSDHHGHPKIFLLPKPLRSQPVTICFTY